MAAALTPETRHIVNAERLAMMKPTAHLISTARGPLVDQVALYEALRDRRIAGPGWTSSSRNRSIRTIPS